MATPAVVAPMIYHLAISRFRGIETFSWNPARGVNVILGGGDVGKTTVLEAIALLLSPIQAAVTDTDYTLRNEKDGFVVEAVMALPPASGIDDHTKLCLPWHWNGTDAVVPDIEGEAAVANEPVYRLRVRGTEDTEAVYEIVQPDGTTEHLPVGLRRKIGLVRLSGDDRNDRDLRLVQGSSLDRLLGDRALRTRLANHFAMDDVTEFLSPEGKAALGSLDESFKVEHLPNNLALAVTGSPGLNVAALIGLTAKRQEVPLPLASWGAGTRRLAALAIAETHQLDWPITVVDEIERGLEYYRLLRLLEKLQAGKSQVFLTTHSSTVIEASLGNGLWYIDHARKIGPLAAPKIAMHSARSPETFLSRLAVVAEGITEVGFVSVLLERALGSALKRHGVHVADGRGHEATLGLLEALGEGGLLFAGFADDEGGKHPSAWGRLKSRLGDLLFRWSSGCLEENVIGAIPEDKLAALIDDPTDEKTGMRLRTLQERLGTSGKDLAALRAVAGAGLKAVIIEAAMGQVPADKQSEAKPYKAHASTWFKSAGGGRELANKVFELGIWPALKPQLLPFCNAIRVALQLPEVPDISS